MPALLRRPFQVYQPLHDPLCWIVPEGGSAHGLDRRDTYSIYRRQGIAVERTDVAVVGAGPYGLAVAVHLEAAGIERLVFGQPLETWRDRMPEGMILKSEPFGSDIASPHPGLSVEEYCRSTGLAYSPRNLPLPRETWLDYADDFVARAVTD